MDLPVSADPVTPPTSRERAALRGRAASRFTIWLAAAGAALAADIWSKASPHPIIAYNHAHTPAFVFLLVGAVLLVLGLLYSNVVAFGSGLMFGGLCGNAGELILLGYATDWIHVGHYLTNIADISGAAGLLCCFAGYVLPLRR